MLLLFLRVLCGRCRRVPLDGRFTWSVGIEADSGSFIGKISELELSYILIVN